MSNELNGLDLHRPVTVTGLILLDNYFIAVYAFIQMQNLKRNVQMTV